MRETRRAQVSVTEQREEHAIEIEPFKTVDGGLIKAIFDPWQRSPFSCSERQEKSWPLLAGKRTVPTRYKSRSL